jgi:hypothetical protein
MHEEVEVEDTDVRSRTRIEVLRSKSRGARLYKYHTDLMDRRPICCHNIIRDSGSRHEGCRDCGEGDTKDQPPHLNRDAYRIVSVGHRRRRQTCVRTPLAGDVWEGCCNDSCVEKEFILGPRKFEEYKGSRFYNGDCALVTDV